MEDNNTKQTSFALLAIITLLITPSLVFIAVPSYDARKIVSFFQVLMTCVLLWIFTKKTGLLIATVSYTIVGLLFLTQQILISF